MTHPHTHYMLKCFIVYCYTYVECSFQSYTTNDYDDDDDNCTYLVIRVRLAMSIVYILLTQ
jgi:hypothetical protein